MPALTDSVLPVQLLAPVANAFAGTVTSTYVNMKNYKNMFFLVYWGVGTTGTSTLTVQAAVDSSGTSATAIPFNYRRVTDTTVSDVPGARTAATSAGFLTTAGSNQLYLLEVDALEIGILGPFVAVVAVEGTASARLGGIMAIMGDPLELGATPNTSLT